MTTTRFWVAAGAAALAASAAAQQVRPDAGTLLETPRQLPAVPPAGGGAPVAVPGAPAVAPYDPAVRVVPTAFELQGNTLFDSARLQAVLAPFVGKEADMGRLQEAAAAVRAYYRERGYPLTEAYLPQQALSASGGPVKIQVLEARVGEVRVRVEGTGVSEALASRIVRAHLRTGDPITEYLLEKPVLLLRDLPGYDATATVDPGRNAGEGDVTVTVKPTGPVIDGSVGADNYGVRAAGQSRVFVNLNANNLTGLGDLFSARLQKADQSGSDLYRLAWTVPVGGYATKLSAGVTRSEYALGRQFAALGASGVADVYSLSVLHPFIRSRAHNLVGSLTLERKDLHDRTATPATTRDSRVDLVRASALGNFVDRLGTDSFSSYAATLSQGRVTLDAASAAIDTGPGGLDTSGHFTKANLEFARTMYFSAGSRLVAMAQAQWASKNLPSAEKFGIGGVGGVRGYPAGEGVGDAGAALNFEYQHQLPDFGTGVPLSGSVFYDVAHVRYNQRNTINQSPNQETLRSAGVGLTAGTYGRYLVTAQLAWRLDRAPVTGDPDRNPRVWLSAQKWF